LFGGKVKRGLPEFDAAAAAADDDDDDHNILRFQTVKRRL